jgi:hypothetical protein
MATDELPPTGQPRSDEAYWRPAGVVVTPAPATRPPLAEVDWQDISNPTVLPPGKA